MRKAKFNICMNTNRVHLDAREPCEESIDKVLLQTGVIDFHGDIFAIKRGMDDDTATI